MENIQLHESVAAALKAQARAQGISLEEYLRRLAGSSAGAESTTSSNEIERLLDEASVPGPDTVAIHSRADVYRDHD